MAEVFSHEQVRYRDMVVSVEHPGLDKPVAIAGIPLKMTETPGRIDRRAPMAGEHTGEILRELGLPAERIAQLQQEHAVG